MTTDTAEQVRTIASDVFNMALMDDSPAAPPESIDEWDSMERLNLVLALEERFEIELTPEEIENMKTLADIALTVERKRAQQPGEP